VADAEISGAQLSTLQHDLHDVKSKEREITIAQLRRLTLGVDGPLPDVFAPSHTTVELEIAAQRRNTGLLPLICVVC